ncbi:restriction endonuclease subunit S [Solitalea lacus]|uniref:restriction endonuclease subunit S n=1 Tax=Solitalea lacus TaxID=2911172 RepID=UPI001EDA1DA6|nr:restriction endonuclease subunit S [Solitalea lacus]UKJ09191.1 restriction endonuclease subunit S [Solitalea lacus]
MSKETINAMVPKLRFPEFKEEGCNIESFGELYTFKVTNSFSRDNLNYESGKVKNIHYGDIHTKFSTLFDITKEKVPFINPSISIEKIQEENYCIEGDIIFADASEDLQDVGKSIEIVNLNNEKLLSGLHTLLARQKEPKLIVGFGGHLFRSGAVRAQIQREAQGAKVLGISGTRLSNIKIGYPNNKLEQQKIRDCLSSLDQLLSAESQKLDVLKAHKKGLMQQLFPAEGETVPKFRFPEFKDNGDWEETTLSQVANYENGKAHEQDIVETGDYVVVNSKFISSDGEERKFTNTAFCLARKGDILMVLSDVPNGKAIAKCFLLDADELYTVNQRICRIIPFNVNNVLLYYILNRNPHFLAFDDGVKQTNLRKEDVLNCPMLIPKDPIEQQKIAECLAALDALITAQAEQIGQLKQHKKGLMQQLFPNLNDINNG